MTTLLAINNASVGYAKTREALSLAVAAEKELLLWPPVLNEEGRWLRRPELTYWGWRWCRGARWARGLVGGKVLVVPTREWSMDQVLAWMKPNTVYIISPRGIQGNKLKAAAEKLGITARRLEVP